MAGLRHDAFITFARGTDKHLFSDPDKFFNDANLYQRYAFADAYRQRKSIQGGNGIQVWRELQRSSTGAFVAPGHVFSPTGVDGMNQSTIGWGRYMNYMLYFDHEIEDNKGDTRAKFFDLYRQKRMAMVVNTVDDQETHLWSAAVNEMEIPIGNTTLNTSIPRKPYSIPALITLNGAAPAAFTTSSGTVQGVSPTTYTNWANQSGQFNTFGSEIEDLLFDMYYLSGWHLPGIQNALFNDTKFDGCIGYCDLVTLRKLRQILLDRNDRLEKIGQYDEAVAYMGKPFVWAPPLGGRATTEANQVVYGVNWNYLFPVVRRDNFLRLMTDKDGREFKPATQPDANIVYEITEYNLVFESRRRHYVLKHASQTS